MADIAMCANIDCPAKENCYRQQAKKNPYGQYYGSFGIASDELGNGCDYFWELEVENTTELITEMDDFYGINIPIEITKTKCCGDEGRTMYEQIIPSLGKEIEDTQKELIDLQIENKQLKERIKELESMVLTGFVCIGDEDNCPSYMEGKKGCDGCEFWK